MMVLILALHCSFSGLTDRLPVAIFITLAKPMLRRVISGIIIESVSKGPGLARAEW